MLHKVITPRDPRLIIDLPASYVGKKIEVIAFGIDEPESTAISEPPIHYTSQEILAKDWLTPEEDTAWKDL